VSDNPPNTWNHQTYDQTIKNNFDYTDKQYDEALLRAAREGKSVVVVFGSEKLNGTQKVVDKSLENAKGLRKDDSIFLYVDIDKVDKNSAIGKYVDRNVRGKGQPLTMTINMEPDANGWPTPTQPTERQAIWGNQQGMGDTVKKEGHDIHLKMDRIKDQFKIGDTPASADRKIEMTFARVDAEMQAAHRATTYQERTAHWNAAIQASKLDPQWAAQQTTRLQTALDAERGKQPPEQAKIDAIARHQQMLWHANHAQATVGFEQLRAMQTDPKCQSGPRDMYGADGTGATPRRDMYNRDGSGATPGRDMYGSSGERNTPEAAARLRLQYMQDASKNFAEAGARDANLLTDPAFRAELINSGMPAAVVDGGYLQTLTARANQLRQQNGGRPVEPVRPVEPTRPVEPVRPIEPVQPNTRPAPAQPDPEREANFLTVNHGRPVENPQKPHHALAYSDQHQAAALKKAAELGLPVIIKFGNTVGCGPCRTMDAQTMPGLEDRFGVPFNAAGNYNGKGVFLYNDTPEWRNQLTDQFGIQQFPSMAVAYVKQNASGGYDLEPLRDNRNQPVIWTGNSRTPPDQFIASNLATAQQRTVRPRPTVPARR
jgi:hypothetical protein